MSNDSHILGFFSTFARTCQPRVVLRALLGAALLCSMGYFGVKWLHKTPGKAATQQTREKEVFRSDNPGRFHDSNPAEQSALRAGSERDLLNREDGKILRPSFKLLSIVRFGRSLELVGEVEAGSRLTLNGVPVEVSGDGSFNHFTKPFPRATKKINLVLKATNLAGESAELIAPYDFRGRNRDH
jgi:hypothetical protein